ncbi:MAG TPA: hypothetical protein VIJ29_04010 [Candidatus Paceibacterota bacterium]
MKRYIYIVIGIIVLAIIAIAVLYFIKGTSAGSSAGTTGTTTTGSLPATGTQGSNGSGTVNPVGTLGLPPTTGSSTASTTSAQVTVQNFGVLSGEPVLDYFVDAHNNITAIEPTGQIIAISNGQTTTVNSSTINDIISASFSYDGKKIVVSYGDPSDPVTEIFDASTSVWTTLAQTMFSPQWSPANNYLLAYLTVPSNSTLALATMNAASPKATPATLITLNANDLNLQWTTTNEFILSDKPTGQVAGSVWAFNSTAGTLTPLLYELPGAEDIWSHDAAIPYGLTFFDNESGVGGATLQLQALSGNLPTEALSISTLPSKCTFNPEMMSPATSTTSSATSTSTSTASSTAAKNTKAPAPPTSTPYLALYCGVPRSSSGFSSAHLPDDYDTMALFTSDDIYKINTATGAIQSLWSDDTQNMDVSDLKFFNNALFFVNRYDQKLYGLTFSN